MPASYHFPDTVRQLREAEQMLLHSAFHPVDAEQEAMVSVFLEKEYARESIDYPHQAPAFDGPAAVWGAKTVYIAAQLLLNRKHVPGDIPGLLPAYTGTIHARAFLSADLCLRFLPILLENALRIDHNDALIPVLEEHLRVWHYSGAGHPPDMALISSDPCLEQRYIDRVIEKKDQHLAAHPLLQTKINAALGNYKHILWK